MKKTYIMPQTATVQFELDSIMFPESKPFPQPSGSAPARQSGKIAGSLYI